MERDKLRILWHSVASYVRSGYGTTTRNITSRLVKHGYDVIVSAYYGLEPGGTMKIFGVPHLPSKEGRFGEISFKAHAARLKPDIILLNCFSEDTEILTKNGWKKGIYLELEDEIASLNRKTGELEYQKPSFIKIDYYKGPMYHLENRYLSFLVTPHHKMYVRRRNKRNQWTLEEVEKIFGKRVEYQKGAKWKGKDKSEINILGKKFRTDDFLKILGLYISEGYCAKGNSFVISQIKKSGKEKIRKILKDIGMKFKETSTGFYVKEEPELTKFFRTLGKNALEKHLPAFVLELSPNHLKVLWESLLIGDGWVTKTGSEIYCSSSKKLIDQLQEMLIKMGYSGDVRINAKERDSLFPNNKTYHSQVNYSITKLTKTTPRTIPYMRKKKRWTYCEEWVPYEGLIWDVKVPNEIVFVRRHGKVAASHETDWWAFPWFPKLPYTSLLHSPMDHTNYPEELINLTKEYDYVCAYCHWQQKELAKHGIKSYYTPHGINIKEYYPIETLKARDITKFPKDKFIIGRVAANCYDSKTEVLTKDGWKNFSEISTDDEALTLNKQNEMEYQKIQEVIKQFYEGKMYRLKTKYLDALVTPNHEMFVKQCKRLRKDRPKDLEKREKLGVSYYYTPYHGETPEELFGKPRFYKKNGGIWKGQEEEFFVLPEYTSVWNTSSRTYYQEEIKIKMNTFLKLLGYYISEGSSNGHTVFISQIKHKEEMKKELKDLPFEVKDYGDKLGINNTPLAEWFKKHVGTNAFNKRIPKRFKNLSKKQLEILWEALCLGDGTKTRSSYAYSTSSKTLAGDIQEILLKMGDYGDIYIKKPNKDHYAGTQLVRKKNCKDNYIIHRNIKIHEVQNRPTKKERPKGFIEEWKNYKGIIWDIRVPNRVVMIRRNGKVMWTIDSDKEDRKSWARIFIALRLFLEDYPQERKNILMYCHTDAEDRRGLPLPRFVHKQGLDDIVKFTNPKMSQIRLTTEEMNYLYNSFDILMNPSKREGFCLDGESRILMKNGIKPIKDIKEGDTVLTHSGKYRKVLKTFSRKIDEEIRVIKFWNLPFDLKITKEHPVLAIKRTSSKINLEKAPTWIPSSELQKGDLVLVPRLKEVEVQKFFDLKNFDDTVLFDESEVWYKMGYSSKKKNSLLKIPRFVKINSELAKLLGIYIAEGSVMHDDRGIQFTLNSKEKELALEIKTLMKTIFGVETHIFERKNRLDISCSGTILAKFFKKLCGNGALNKKIPREILFGRNENLEVLMEYLWKGDGYLTPHANELSTSSLNLVYDCILGLLKLGYKFRVGKFKRKKNEEYSIRYLLRRGRVHSNKCWILQDYGAFLVKEVSNVNYKGLVYNLEVEKDNSYVPGIAVHNCLPILEALACGKPVIATDFSSMTELVKGRGWLVKSALQGENLITTPINAQTAIPDVYGIKDAIEDAYFHPAKIKKFSKKCREFALDFDWDRIIEKQWLPLLEEIPELEEQKKKKRDEEIKKEFKSMFKKIKERKKAKK